jgi:hypothetical protein
MVLRIVSSICDLLAMIPSVAAQSFSNSGPGIDLTLAFRSFVLLREDAHQRIILFLPQRAFDLAERRTTLT